MKLIVDDISYDVPDELVKEQSQRLFEFLLLKYESAPMFVKLGAQGLVRATLPELLSTLPKGADPVYHIGRFVPEALPESLHNAQLTITTSRQNDTASIAAFDFSIQNQSQVGG